MDWITTVIVYFGSGVIVGMIAGVYLILDDHQIRRISRYVEQLDTDDE